MIIFEILIPDFYSIKNRVVLQLKISPARGQDNLLKNSAAYQEAMVKKRILR